MWTRKTSPDAREVDVRVILRGPLGREAHTKLILDTGSPFTILNIEFARTIDLHEDRAEGPSRLWSPTGPDNGYRIRTAAVTTMGRTLVDFQIRCHQLVCGLKANGVIGLDIIRQGRLTFHLSRTLVEFEWD